MLNGKGKLAAVICTCFIAGGFLAVCAVSFSGCSDNDIAQMQRVREARTAMYQSEYATVVNKLEMIEGNFKTYRRVVFYNVRLGETVFACEGFCHVQVDRDGDIEIVVKTGDGRYLRHYLGQKEDITYFSEQLEGVEADSGRYQIMWNPKLWFPEFKKAE